MVKCRVARRNCWSAFRFDVVRWITSFTTSWPTALTCGFVVIVGFLVSPVPSLILLAKCRPAISSCHSTKTAPMVHPLQTGLQILPLLVPIIRLDPRKTLKRRLPRVKVLTINCRSLRSEYKRCESISIIYSHQPDIINATENHWYNESRSAELYLPDYEISRRNRYNGSSGPGGGRYSLIRA